LAQQRRWLEAAGAELQGDEVEVEVLPSVTYAGEGLEWVKGKKLGRGGVIGKEQDVEELLA
jgi:UDP-N-acetylglucosamine/UDP-N-acetylgalactosamine diphosphorylase